MRVQTKALICCLFIAAMAVVIDAIANEVNPVRVVYHVDGGIDQAAFTMANIRNHLKADPEVRVVVVANGPGIDFLLEGAKDKNGNPFDATIDDLLSQGVVVRACASTLDGRGISRSLMHEGVELVPSGVAEIARLQYVENYAYLKP